MSWKNIITLSVLDSISKSVEVNNLETTIVNFSKRAMNQKCTDQDCRDVVVEVIWRRRRRHQQNVRG